MHKSYSLFVKETKSALYCAIMELSYALDSYTNDSIIDAALPGLKRAMVLSSFLAYAELSQALALCEKLIEPKLDKKNLSMLKTTFTYIKDLIKTIDDTVEPYGHMITSEGFPLRVPKTKTINPDRKIKNALENCKTKDYHFFGQESGYSKENLHEIEVAFSAAEKEKAIENNKNVSLIVIELSDQDLTDINDFSIIFTGLINSGLILRYGSLELPLERLKELNCVLPIWCITSHSESIKNTLSKYGLKVRYSRELLLKDVKKAKDEVRVKEETFPGSSISLTIEEKNEEEKKQDPIEFDKNTLSVSDEMSLINEITPEHVSKKEEQKNSHVDAPLPKGVVLPRLEDISCIESEIPKLNTFVFDDNYKKVVLSGLESNNQSKAMTIDSKENKPIVVKEEKKVTPNKDNKNKSNKKVSQDLRKKIRFPIALKLILIISALFIFSLTVMISIASYFFQSDSKIRVEESTLQIADILSLKVEEDLFGVYEKAALLIKEARTIPETEGYADLFALDREIISIAVFSEDTEIKPFIVTNSSFLTEKKIDLSIITSAFSLLQTQIVKAQNGETSCTNISQLFKEPVLAINLPYTLNNKKAALSVCFSSKKRFQNTLSSKSIQTTFVVNAEGALLVHPDTALVNAVVSYAKDPMITFIQKSTANNGQTRYQNEKNEWYLGSFKRTAFAGICVVAIVPENKAYEAVFAILRWNIYLALSIVGMAILIVYFYSKTLSRQINVLVDAAQKIETGDFILDLKAKTKDEIGLLTESFNEMGFGLDEREKAKDALGRFVNKDIAEKAMRGELKLGGERKKATIFFSDIRGFTSISENLLPEEVVEFLNKYMTRMVHCVNETHGVVDKYIGDAIMAVWGTPDSKGNDSENAVNAALMMRSSLIEFNKDRGGDRKPIIRIGCGINTGPVIAGQIGSEERMEYTVIGDAVNLASRIEALNKPFGSDVLISADVYEEVKSIFRCEAMKPIAVKGKAENQQIYAVLGRLDNIACPSSLLEVQNLLGIETKDLSKVNVDEEEVKYKIVEEKKE